MFLIYSSKTMPDKSNIKKIEDEKKLNIQKTMGHPINEALKWWELKAAILSQGGKQQIAPLNQISISLDKYENKVIRKRKIKTQ